MDAEIAELQQDLIKRDEAIVQLRLSNVEMQKMLGQQVVQDTQTSPSVFANPHGP